jgi:hypothetical protein
MKRLFAGPCALVLLSLISSLPPVQAQTAEFATRHETPFSFEISKKTTLIGTVSSVVTNPSAGMMWGSHLLVETSSGTLDASLGRFALLGRNALFVTAGQCAQVTGVMKTFDGQQVFLARTLIVGGQVYPIRDEHGFAPSPQTRERLSHSSGQEGEQP